MFERPAANRASLIRIRGQHRLVFGRQDADGPISSRACAVCSGVVRYGCAPALRSAESSVPAGPGPRPPADRRATPYSSS